jgi:hypothetical protein
VSKFPDTEITISVAKDHGIALPSDTGNITHTALRESNRGGHLVGVPLQLKKLASAHRTIVKISSVTEQNFGKEMRIVRQGRSTNTSSLKQPITTSYKLKFLELFWMECMMHERITNICSNFLKP